MVFTGVTRAVMISNVLRILLVVFSIYLTLTTSAANGVVPAERLMEAVGSNVPPTGVVLPYGRTRYPKHFKRPSPAFAPLAVLVTQRDNRDGNDNGFESRRWSRQKRFWAAWEDAAGFQNGSGNQVFEKGAIVPEYKGFLDYLQHRTFLTHLHDAESTGEARQYSRSEHNVFFRPPEVMKVSNDRPAKDGDRGQRHSQLKDSNEKAGCDVRDVRDRTRPCRRKDGAENSHRSEARKAVAVTDFMNLASGGPKADDPAKASGHHDKPGTSNARSNVVIKRQDDVLDTDDTTGTPRGQGRNNGAEVGTAESIDMAEMYDAPEFQEFRMNTERQLAVPIRAGLVKFAPVRSTTQGVNTKGNSRQHTVKRRGGYDAPPLYVCPSVSDWITRRKAKDPYGRTLEVLEMIPYNGTLVRQYFYETFCVHHSQPPSAANTSRASRDDQVTPSECLAVDKQASNSRCLESYIWTYGKVAKQNGDIGWSVIGIRGSCSCSVWPKRYPAGRRAGPRLFIDDLDE